jgi:hypothetical protein
MNTSASTAIKRLMNEHRGMDDDDVLQSASAVPFVCLSVSIEI